MGGGAPTPAPQEAAGVDDLHLAAAALLVTFVFAIVQAEWNVLPNDLPGPLAGVLAGLDWAAEQGADTLVRVAADTPSKASGLMGVFAKL